MNVRPTPPPAPPTGLLARLRAMAEGEPEVDRSWVHPRGDGPRASHPAAGPETSVRLRVAVLVNTLVAFLAYSTVDLDVMIWPPVALVIAGAAFSHVRREHRNLALKWLLAAGMLIALWQALGNLVRGAVDPRLALAQLLFWLQVLNSFDLPRRRNLRVAILVASVLMIVTGTLSRTSDYGLILMAFAATLAWASYEGFAAEVGARPASGGRTAGLAAAVMVAAGIIGAPVFLLAPRQERTLSGVSLPLSFSIPLPDLLSPRVRPARASAGGNNTANSDTRGSFGSFAQELDLNARGAPSEEIIMRVQADRGEYWRAIAYDRFDGRIWSMGEPEAVVPYNVSQPPMRLKKPDSQAQGSMVTQTFYIERDQANMIFAALTATTVYFPTGLIWRDKYGSLRAPVQLQEEMYYSVISETPEINLRMLERAARKPIPPQFANYLELPRLSSRVRTFALDTTKGATTYHAKMLKLRDKLAADYPYKLDIASPAAGAETTDDFLFVQKAGFCQQFATALAVTGRLNGVPTRLVTGFVPGDYNPFTGLWEVKGKHAHAWVEAWLPGLGWTTFDATPSSWMPGFDGNAPKAGPYATLNAFWKFILPHAGPLLVLIGLGLLAASAWAVRDWLRARAAQGNGPGSRIYRRLRRRLHAKWGVPDRASDAPREWLAGAAREPRLETALPALTAVVARYEAVRFGGGAEAELHAAVLVAEAALGSAARRS